MAMERRLRIGISSCFLPPDPARPVFTPKRLLYVEESMAHWVASRGALAYPVPTTGPGSPPVEAYAADLDGLVLHGGSDVCPRTYGEEPLQARWEGDEPRDRYELALVEAFAAAARPVFGVCRGMQLLNVWRGGTLYQDIATQVETDRLHRHPEHYDAHRHEVVLEPGSLLADLHPGTARVTVNSVHHQAVKDLGSGLRVEARSAEDGLVEAVRLDGSTWVAGVQWHPEFAFTGPHSRAEGGSDLHDDEPLLDAFLAACAERAR